MGGKGWQMEGHLLGGQETVLTSHQHLLGKNGGSLDMQVAHHGV
jgi:hypothetical protein